MARYRKIDTRIWNDHKFNALSDDGKLVLFFVLTHPHLTPLGAMRATHAGLASELRWTPERFKQALEESTSKNIVHYDENAAFICLPNFLKYNLPESPNVVRSWEQYLDYLPECLLKENLINNIRNIVASLSFPFQEALPQVFTKGMPNQEQEQEQKQEQEQEKRFMSGKPDIVVPFSAKDNKSNEEDCTAEQQSGASSDDDEDEQLPLKDQALAILQFLNTKTGRVYRPVETNLKLIEARLKSGATRQDCFQVIAKKTREWKGNPKMDEYLRPATLFNATKFEQYMGELVIPGGNSNE